MKNTFKVLFYVKRNAVKKTGKAPIIARITVDQAISQFNTQLEIDPDQWDAPRGKATGEGPKAQQINSLPNDIRLSINRQQRKFYRYPIRTPDRPPRLTTLRAPISIHGGPEQCGCSRC